MGFNYAREKREFDKEWVRLRAEYEAAEMPEGTIQKLYAYDWKWFCSRRNFANHSQELPVERIEDDTSQSALVNKFETMRTTFDESAFDGRYAWVDTVEDAALLDKLKRLSQEDLDLLTRIAIEGYSQSGVARLNGCARNTISKKIARIKKYLF